MPNKSQLRLAYHKGANRLLASAGISLSHRWVEHCYRSAVPLTGIVEEAKKWL